MMSGEISIVDAIYSKFMQQQASLRKDKAV